MEAFIEIYPDMNANLLANVTRITIEKVRRIRGYGQAPQQAPAVEPGTKSNQEVQQQQQPGIPNRVIRRSSLLQQLLISKIAQKVSQMLMYSQPQPEARNSVVHSDIAQSDQQRQGNSQQVTNINAANTAGGPVPQQQQQQERWQRPDLSSAPPSHLPHPPALPVSVTAGSKRPSSSFSSSSSCAEDEEVDTVDDRLSDSVNPTSAEQSMQNASGKQSRPKKSPRKSCSNSTAEGVFVFPPRSVADVEPVGVETVPEVNATPALCGSQLASAGSPITRSLSEPHLTHVDHHVPVQKLVGLSISGNEHGRGQQVLSYSAPEITADATCKGCVRCPTTAAWAPPTELRLCQPMTH